MMSSSDLTTDAEPRVTTLLRQNIRINDTLADSEGGLHRRVMDWIGRGRDHRGFFIGEDAARLLDLLDGRSKKELLTGCKDRLGSSFNEGHLDSLLKSLERMKLMYNKDTQSWLQELHKQALAPGFRPSVVADSCWYPGEPAELNGVIEKLMDPARESCTIQDTSTVRAIVAPHAGFEGSGSCAAKAFASVWDIKPPETVILLGPNHCYRQDEIDIATIPFETPLGVLQPAGEDILELAGKLPHVQHNGLAQFREHSLEMELPFLQYVAQESWQKAPKIVPIIVSREFDQFFCPTKKQIEGLDTLAEALVQLLVRPDVLLVVSGDLTHYGPSFNYVPFSEDFNKQIEALDSEALDAFVALDTEKMLKCFSSRNWCGGPSFYVMAQVAKKLALKPALVDYSLHPEDEWLEGGHTTSFAALAFTEK